MRGAYQGHPAEGETGISTRYSGRRSVKPSGGEDGAAVGNQNRASKEKPQSSTTPGFIIGGVCQMQTAKFALELKSQTSGTDHMA